MPKPNSFDGPSDEDDEEIKTIVTKVKDSEKRLTKLIEKRNELNDTARAAREGRDVLNDQKRTLVDEMRRLQAERDRLNAESRAAREERNKYQAQAKSLIEAKRRKRKDGGGYQGKVRELEGQIKSLQFKQETSSMPVHEENAMIDKIKALTKELEVAKVQFSEEAALLAEVKDIDQKIDELFKEADTHHKVVVEKSNEAQKFHDQIVPILGELKFLDQSSDAKHEAYIKARQEADAFHKQGLEMRDELMKARGERSAVFGDRKAIVRDQNKSVAAELFDQKKLDQAADDAVALLLKKGKIQL